jgi:hypothetical protein
VFAGVVYREDADLSFSLSTFTVELNGMPTVVFQAKWHAEAEDICRGWANSHWDAITEQHISGITIAPVIKVRLASAIEKAAYEAAGDQIEFFGELQIVRLSDAAGHPDEAGESVATENQEGDPAAEREGTHDEEGQNSIS